MTEVEAPPPRIQMSIPSVVIPSHRDLVQQSHRLLDVQDFTGLRLLLEAHPDVCWRSNRGFDQVELFDLLLPATLIDHHVRGGPTNAPDLAIQLLVRYISADPLTEATLQHFIDLLDQDCDVVSNMRLCLRSNHGYFIPILRLLWDRCPVERRPSDLLHEATRPHVQCLLEWGYPVNQSDDRDRNALFINRQEDAVRYLLRTIDRFHIDSLGGTHVLHHFMNIPWHRLGTTSLDLLYSMRHVPEWWTNIHHINDAGDSAWTVCQRYGHAEEFRDTLEQAHQHEERNNKAAITTVLETWSMSWPSELVRLVNEYATGLPAWRLDPWSGSCPASHALSSISTVIDSSS